jgi:hypothetical protein
MPRLELFPFRYRDRLTGKWVKARYVAERHEIAARYAEWEIIGSPEIRDVSVRTGQARGLVPICHASAGVAWDALRRIV